MPSKEQLAFLQALLERWRAQGLLDEATVQRLLDDMAAHAAGAAMSTAASPTPDATGVALDLAPAAHAALDLAHAAPGDAPEAGLAARPGKANSDKIKDADLIYPGQELGVDKAPTESAMDAATKHAKTRGAWSVGAVEESDKGYLNSGN